MRLREFPKSIGPVSGRAGIQNSDFRVPFLPNAHDVRCSHTGTGEVINKKLLNCLMDSVYLNNFSLFFISNPNISKTELVIFPLPNRLCPWPPASHLASIEILESLLIHPLYPINHHMLSVLLPSK